LCFQNKKNLLDSENCARNCYKPILYSKKNVSILIENLKESLEKCRFDIQLKSDDVNMVKKETDKCLEKYKLGLNGIKDEVEYIYKGYMKNYDMLIQEAEKKI
jgi:hypothetical protein